jgi:hypothetical protein
VTERFGTPLYVRVDIAHDDAGRPLLMSWRRSSRASTSI